MSEKNFGANPGWLVMDSADNLFVVRCLF